MNLELNNNDKYLLLMCLAQSSYECFTGFKREKFSERYLLIERIAQLGQELPPPSKATSAMEESLSSVVGRSAEPGRAETPPSTTPRGGTEAAKAILAPIPDYGARPKYDPQAAQYEIDERKRQAQPRPILWAEGKANPGATIKALRILGVIRKDAGAKPRLLLKTADGTISLWDKNLFDSVASKVNIPWTYYLTTSADGKYTNMAGMEQP